MNKRFFVQSTLAVALSSTLAGATFASGTETAVKPEVNPPGDIPDSQVFIRFESPAGFSLKVPEGWARADSSNQSVFSDKYNRIVLTISVLDQALDLSYGKSVLAAEIEKTAHAVKIVDVLELKMKAGNVIRIIYDSNSEPNSVTNKQVRQENERFYFANAGKLVALDLSAPKGADNVDQWKLISSSFRWK